MSVDIGERIRSLRTARGLSQEEVARRTGIGLKSYGDLERGRTKDPHYSTLRGVARALNVRVEELLEEPVPLGDAPGEAGLSEEREEERRAGYLRAWRAFVYKLVQRWEQDPPKSSREIAVVLDAMQDLLEERAFERPPEQITTSNEREVSEWLDLSLLFRGIDRLNQIEIVDTVEEMSDTAQERAEAARADAEAERLRATFREIKGQLAG
jgi:transcriptional regulator with XRE-family HTH domain